MPCEPPLGYALRMTNWLILLALSAAALLLGAAVLHLIPRFGSAGKAASAWLCRAPGLDVLITYFTVLPMFTGLAYGAAYWGSWYGWFLGLLAGILGQIVGLLIWTVLHELFNRKHIKGPRIVSHINARVGSVRNHSAVWITALAVPVFWLLRVAEYVVYPPLTWLIRLPKYRHADWVNVSRHKFNGLVGHDLIWCLYCDWMTGAWSLGGEMLRNVESFWCPIRFDSNKKCANCKVDYPDIDGGWAPSDGTMADVIKVLDKHYPGPDNTNPWFGHPTRLTVSATPSRPPADKQNADANSDTDAASGDDSNESA